MKYLILPLLFISLYGAGQTTVPITAEPIYALKVVSTGFSTLDTFYLDESVFDTSFQQHWNPVYHVSRIESSGEYDNGFPKLVGYQWTIDNITYFRELNFFADRTGVVYDYDVEQGDSLWIMAPQANPLLLDPLYHVIDSVVFSNCSHMDSVKVVYTKVLFNYPTATGIFYRDIWIEGIGSTFHGLFPVACIEGGSGECEKFYLNQYRNTEEGWINARMIECNTISTSVTREANIINGLEVFPNPIKIGQPFTVNVTNFSVKKYHIYSLSGKEVRNSEIRGSSVFNVETDNLQKGIYFIEFLMIDGTVSSKKIILY
jgi:hypothetical protein